jgi:hypothetical protein
MKGGLRRYIYPDCKIYCKRWLYQRLVAENYKNSKTAQMCIDLIKSGPKWVPGKTKRVVTLIKTTDHFCSAGAAFTRC